MDSGDKLICFIAACFTLTVIVTEIADCFKDDDKDDGKDKVEEVSK